MKDLAQGSATRESAALQDDGAAAHLPGMHLPSVKLAATNGHIVDLSTLRGRTVVYAYPRTGVPGQPSPEGWDRIPGARGCTPQNTGFRDRYAELIAYGAAQVYGLSTQDSADQREAAERLQLPFPLLSDAQLQLARLVRLPTFDIAGMTLLKRLALIIDDGVATKVFYPVSEPERNAADVAAWLAQHSVA